MKKLVAAGIFIVVLVEVTAIAVLDREIVLVVVGAMVALVLLSLRFYLVREGGDDSETLTNDAAESLRRWLSRTETLVSRAESTRRDWDRHLRPMLARQFELATGHRQAGNHAAFHATGTMLFGTELWGWVDPQNVSRTGESEPGPGREALDEILRRLEQV
ncbi:hypothetical protein Mycsm_06359 [Mycobacterium sp. JS623]|uniref:hypothetical protein n=1 Tax=Mycobacterium sp. JS623 TaxID=212767 RepID=UPI0002A55520|nr:hypothetical protein [Mycobacterium sp. JS623]AGB26511.1 hypothetical protein Mycsm_06359 [Mycobacterium sp. JS623]